jgi:hypothetical protein
MTRFVPRGFLSSAQRITVNVAKLPELITVTLERRVVS